ncbi:hypothetical protein ACOMHN_049806 [Nucella lapillus]
MGLTPFSLSHSGPVAASDLVMRYLFGSVDGRLATPRLSRLPPMRLALLGDDGKSAGLLGGAISHLHRATVADTAWQLEWLFLAVT